MAKTRVALPKFGDSGLKEEEGPRMLITTDDGAYFLRVPFSPTEIEHTDLAPIYGEVKRTPDRQSLLVRTGGSLRKMSFTLFLGDESGTPNVGSQLRQLEQMGFSVHPILVYYSWWDGNVRWKITDFSHRDILHDPISNEITRAEAQITFTEWSVIGSGSVSPREPGGFEGRELGGQRAIPPVHIVKAGDTLTGLARRYYEDESLWKHLGDLNDIFDPRADMTPGTTLKLPKKLSQFSRDVAE